MYEAELVVGVRCRTGTRHQWFRSQTAGCATQGFAVPEQGSNGASFEAAATAAPSATFTPPSPDQNIGPRLVIPATGGAPVIGIPVGGDLYIPVTGGVPITGIPIGP
jgi:hypothetical protein